MSRKLATIREVKEILPIDGADSIELAIIDGWQCVVKKGEFKKFDCGVYFEIDSLLPCEPVFSFLESKGRKKNADGTEGYRLKTIKLKGQLSQGLLMPIDLFFTQHNLSLGDDVTDILHVTLYEPPVSPQLQGISKGSFPSFIPKTDEERIQNLDIKDLYGDYFVTEKIDGTSATYYLDDNDCLNVCSRNLNLKQSDSNLYWKVAIWLDIENKLKNFNKDFHSRYAIQGEIVGEGIQGNPYKIKGQQFYIFNIFDILKVKYVIPLLASGMCNNCLYIPHVPIINECFTIQPDTTIDDLLLFSDGKSQLNKYTQREGVVFKRDVSGLYGKQSFKVISNKYLLG